MSREPDEKEDPRAPENASRLMAAVRRNEPDARRELFDCHAEAIWRVLYRFTGQYDEAHDLAQETFLRAFARADEFLSIGSLRGWLTRIALNLARDDLRKRRRRKGLLKKWPDPPPDDLCSDPYLDARVRDAVEALQEEQRLVVLMHDLEGYTHEEIADALGIAPGSSRARLSRARAKLRDSLASLRR